MYPNRITLIDGCKIKIKGDFLCNPIFKILVMLDEQYTASS